MQPWKSPELIRTNRDGVQLTVFDTGQSQIVPVGPHSEEDRSVGIYVCGITPYDATHMGHAFTYLTFDLVNRVWRDLGLEVTYIQNVTDVDDPLLERAEKTGVDWRELAKAETEQFSRDMEALRIIAPDRFMSVSEAMPLIESGLKTLMEAGYLYQIEDEYPDWYFSCEKESLFGSEFGLSEATMMELFAERGGDPRRPGKKHPLDALVWRQTRMGEPSWDSFLGRGRPGWHIQCSVIAHADSEVIDIQGGGTDLIFPHHEICASICRVLTGESMAHAYVHSAMVGLDGEKMSKSKGNLVKVAELINEGIDPMVIRVALLSHHYRSEWTWTTSEVKKAEDRLQMWSQARHGSTSIDFSDYASQIRGYLREDLHADQALQVLDTWSTLSLAATTDHAGAPENMAQVTDYLLGVAIP
ncbi:MAG: cysteine--1-D-myo-inosityl 2-amino-2-deoxy-alpha-D-glucopyranoside ligase [Propionibacteriaceae bacterium]|jgi:L-cysteine:1D-myo-inositol 2-amino-2-deoxy-alpha-D-glucopyranoside ligase|nr:cysteine--1-D-myo-inosityl 2-amino-2-deoxy-alpha-D-glucopyranoside ligase [Propionibacteriaceae bacterium]